MLPVTPLAIKQPYWKRSPYLLLVAVGIYIGYILWNEGVLNSLSCAAVLSAIGIIGFLIPQTALLIDSEGITPVCKQPKSAVVKIPWSIIDRFDIKNLTSTANEGSGRGWHTSSASYVEIFVNDQNFIAENPKLFRGVGSIFQRFFEAQFEKNQPDRPVYIPLLLLPWSANTAVEELNALRPGAAIPQTVLS